MPGAFLPGAFMPGAFMPGAFLPGAFLLVSLFVVTPYGVSPGPTSRNLYLSVFLSVCHSFCIQLSRRRREASCDVARLLLMAPIDPWRNSTPDFGAVAFCTTNIEDFRTPLTKTSSSISTTYSSH